MKLWIFLYWISDLKRQRLLDSKDLRPNRDEETVKVENLSKHRFAGKEKGWLDYTKVLE